MVNVYVHQHGETKCVDRVEPAWLDPASAITLWVDLAAATPDETRAILADTFRFHPLAVEDAASEIHHPKVESYDGFLYLQFWWVAGMMAALTAVMLAFFRAKRWI